MYSNADIGSGVATLFFKNFNPNVLFCCFSLCCFPLCISPFGGRYIHSFSSQIPAYVDGSRCRRVRGVIRARWRYLKLRFYRFRCLWLRVTPRSWRCGPDRSCIRGHERLLIFPFPSFPSLRPLFLPSHLSSHSLFPRSRVPRL